jgi:type IV secretion system protein VirD4
MDWHPLVRAFDPSVAASSRMLLVLDEAAAPGPLAVLRQAITLLRWVGVAIWSFWQDASQLRSLYPETWPTILNNCAVVQLFGARNQLMADEFAGLVGGISGETLMRLERDQQLLSIHGMSLICRRLNYLRDTIFQGRFDANPIYGQNAHRGADHAHRNGTRPRKSVQRKALRMVQVEETQPRSTGMQTETHRI